MDACAVKRILLILNNGEFERLVEKRKGRSRKEFLVDPHLEEE